ncbi:TadE/TadG family type IV pilus assembly protein [Promicromonospora xylanilytica]
MRSPVRHAPRTWPHCGRRGRHDEEGSATAELVIVLPAVLLLTFLGVQAGMIYHARQVVLAAANQGALAASSEYGTAADGQAAAGSFLGQTGDVALSTWTVTADRDGERAVVRIEGQPFSVIPFWIPTVSAQASMPAEHVVPLERSAS